MLGNQNHDMKTFLSPIISNDTMNYKKKLGINYNNM